MKKKIAQTIAQARQAAFSSVMKAAGFWCLGLGIAVLLYQTPFPHFPSHAVATPVSSRVAVSTSSEHEATGLEATGLETTESLSLSSPGVELIQQGRDFYTSTNYAEAVQALQRAAIALEAEHLPLNQALALSYLALTYNRLGDRDAAQAALQSSRLILADQRARRSTSPVPSSPADSSLHAVQAQVLNASGHLHLAWGNYREALDDWHEAEASYRLLGDRVGQIGSTINQAQALQSMGQIAQASQLLEASATELDDPTVDAEVRVIGYWKLGTTYRMVGNLLQSQSELEKSLSLLPDNQHFSMRDEIKLDLANTYHAMGKRAIAIGQDDAALDFLNRAIQIYEAIGQRQFPGDGDRLSAIPVKAKLNHLSLTLDLQQRSQAFSSPSTSPEWTTLASTSRVQQLTQALSTTLPRLPLNRNTLYARLSFVHSLTRQLDLRSDDEGGQEFVGDDVQKAAIAQLLVDVYQDAQHLKDGKAESLALGRLGTFYEQQQQWNDAEVLTQHALSISRKLYANELSYQWQWQLGRLLTHQKNDQDALEFYQNAVTSLESIRSNLRFVDADIQFSFRDSVEPVYREYLALLLRTDHGTTPGVDSLKRAVLTVNDLQLTELENYLSCNLSSETNQIVGFDRPRGFETDDNLAHIDASAAIIHPILLADRLAVILELPSEEPTFVFNEIELPRSDVEMTVRRLRKNLSSGPDRTPDVLDDAQTVYQWLIEPFKSEFDQFAIQTLVFVLDGSLRNIPMAVLFDGERYLVQQYGIAIAPQLELLRPAPLSASLGVFTGGIGDSQSIEGRQFSEIENLVPELEGIRQLNGSGPILLGEDFTKENLADRLNSGRFSAIHIKTHGVFSSDPDETFIVAAGELIRSRELGNLIRRSIRQNAAPIDLLVLSACSTAKGDNRAVLGLAGVAVQAGVNSTVSTLWDAQDEPNTDLMLAFHRYLRDGSSRADALRRAQLHLIETRYAPPFFWAPYVLVGSWL
ncbi:MAG: CHAT domain-containing protein [Leptolyngbyaceae bacterium]|nr:CHAT domain-containing protein [Leptolyngbyaceae bacterium]